MAIFVEHNRIRGTDSWKIPVVAVCPVPIETITFDVIVGGADDNDVGIGDICEFLQNDGDQGDVREVTPCTDESLVCSVVIVDDDFNRKQLAEDEGEDSYSELTRSTAQFKTGSTIHAAWLMPGMIINAKLKASETPHVGTKAVSGANGSVKAHPNDLALVVNGSAGDTDDVSGYRDSPTIGFFCGKATSVASIQIIPVMIK